MQSNPPEIELDSCPMQLEISDVDLESTGQIPYKSFATPQAKDKDEPLDLETPFFIEMNAQ
jgi:hypothetical protein